MPSPSLQQLGQRNAVPAGKVWRREDQTFVGNQRAADRYAGTAHRPVLGQQRLGVHEDVGDHALRPRVWPPRQTASGR